MTNDPWYYFGTFVSAGHFLHDERMRRTYQPSYLARFDGALAPRGAENQPYVATVSRLNLGGTVWSALSFWDYGVDDRGGSNSIFFAPTLDLTPEELLAEAQRRFPLAFKRLPQPVTLWPSPSLPTPTSSKA
jgi:hypothetical protein